MSFDELVTAVENLKQWDPENLKMLKFDLSGKLTIRCKQDPSKETEIELVFKR